MFFEFERVSLHCYIWKKYFWVNRSTTYTDTIKHSSVLKIKSSLLWEIQVVKNQPLQPNDSISIAKSTVLTSLTNLCWWKHDPLSLSICPTFTMFTKGSLSSGISVRFSEVSPRTDNIIAIPALLSCILTIDLSIHFWEYFDLHAKGLVGFHMFGYSCRHWGPQMIHWYYSVENGQTCKSTKNMFVMLCWLYQKLIIVFLWW